MLGKKEEPFVLSNCRLCLTTFFFVHPFFLFFTPSAPPFPTKFSSPKSPLSGTSVLLFLVKKWQPAGAGFWGRFWTGSPHRKKRNILFFWRAKKRSMFDLCLRFPDLFLLTCLHMADQSLQIGGLTWGRTASQRCAKARVIVMVLSTHVLVVVVASLSRLSKHLQGHPSAGEKIN